MISLSSSLEEVASRCPFDDTAAPALHHILRDLNLKHEVSSVQLLSLEEACSNNNSSSSSQANEIHVPLCRYVLEGVLPNAKAGSASVRVYLPVSVDSQIDLNSVLAAAVACSKLRKECFLCIHSSENVM
jgi:hypothetical protein